MGAADLSALLARVESAEGPDRELDLAILRSLPVEGGWFMAWPDHLTWDSLGPGKFAPPLTASLDAALALRDRLFPTWLVNLGDLDPSDPRAVATLAVGYPDQPSFRGFAAPQCYALALVAALLKAKIAQDSA